MPLVRIHPFRLPTDRVLTWMLTVRLPSWVVAIRSMFGVFFKVSTAIQPRLESSAAAKYSPDTPVMLLAERRFWSGSTDFFRFIGPQYPVFRAKEAMSDASTQVEEALWLFAHHPTKKLALEKFFRVPRSTPFLRSANLSSRALSRSISAFALFARSTIASYFPPSSCFWN